MAAASDRRMRGFKRWMKYQGIECSDALLLLAENGDGDDTTRSLSISVKALCDFKEGDVVATIPKQSCLTVKTSAACHLIEEGELGGYLGLAVALMYEKSLGPQSKWYQYLQILPPFEPIPLLWSMEEIDSFLSGTELHKIVKEDKALVYQDWEECIRPLLELDSFKLNPNFFTVDEYLAAKSLIASRSFQIDDYHGFGMVPLADLPASKVSEYVDKALIDVKCSDIKCFNHKTAAEDVHFTAVSSSSESDDDSNYGKENDDNDDGDDEPIASDFNSETGSIVGSDLELSSSSVNEPTFMEMIIIKDVKAGVEVFNTYGSLGNAALLHRYGFTEPDNPFDILNIDLELVVQWSKSLFSCRHSRRRLSLWRKWDYSGCVSQDSEYFEISFDGEPQIELLVLLYIMLLPEKEFQELDLALSGTERVTKTPTFCLLGKESLLEDSESSKKLLLTRNVRKALVSLADARESFYGPNSLEDDVRSFNECCLATNPKLYHALMLHISERRILGKLRSFAASGAEILRAAKGIRMRKRVKRA